jgi:8-oxo-dGTP pyrophosphatase MutT (NUDIX family)
MMKTQDLQTIAALINNYSAVFPDEQASIDLFNSFLIKAGSLTRAQEIGHITASAWIVNQRKDMTLLTHHAKLNLWLQLGGHMEDGEDLYTAALREASEESGLNSIKLISSELYDIDAHLIPERRGDDEHFHFDLRFLIEADSDEALQISSESKDLRWVKIEDVKTLNDSPSVMRMVNKMPGVLI